MNTDTNKQLLLVESIDDSVYFSSLFSSAALIDIFQSKFINSTGKGTDRLNGFQFSKMASSLFEVAATKCLVGRYRFAPYLEKLRLKGRGKAPRLISIPTIRDRVVLHQLNRYLATIYPQCVPKNIASSYVRSITEDLKKTSNKDTWVCGCDIQTFYDAIQPSRLLTLLEKKITCWQAITLIKRALATPIVPQNTPRNRHKDYRSKIGVPQGLAISNILAAIYMQEADSAMQKLPIAYYRYVDDVLIYGPRCLVQDAYAVLCAQLTESGLTLHPLNSGKGHLEPLSKQFGYLGYLFRWPLITVRESTIERLLQSIAAKFSDYLHNKTRRLERYKYLTEVRLAEIFLMELNERITGAVSEHKRYGWIAYFNQITDLSLLHRLDHSISDMFNRLSDFEHKPPLGLRRLSRAYFEMKYNPTGGYVRNYDAIVTRAQKLTFLEERGRVGSDDALTDDQISDRYERYRSRVLAEMHSDEGVLYG